MEINLKVLIAILITITVLLFYRYKFKIKENFDSPTLERIQNLLSLVNNENAHLNNLNVTKKTTLSGPVKINGNLDMSSDIILKGGTETGGKDQQIDYSEKRFLNNLRGLKAKWEKLKPNLIKKGDKVITFYDTSGRYKRRTTLPWRDDYNEYVYERMSDRNQPSYILGWFNGEFATNKRFSGNWNDNYGNIGDLADVSAEKYPLNVIQFY